MQTRETGSGAVSRQRQAILAAALGLLSRSGPEAVTLEEVATCSGLSLATLSGLFASVEEIRRALAAEAVGLLKDSLASALAKLDADGAVTHPGVEAPWQPSGARRARGRLEAVTAAYLGFFDEHRSHYVVAECLHQEATAPLLEAAATVILPIVAEVLAEAGALGSADNHDPWETALALWAMLDAALIAAVGRGEEYRGLDHQRAAARALEIMLGGLAEPQQGPPKRGS